MAQYLRTAAAALIPAIVSGGLAPAQAQAPAPAAQTATLVVSGDVPQTLIGVRTLQALQVVRLVK